MAKTNNNFMDMVYSAVMSGSSMNGKELSAGLLSSGISFKSNQTDDSSFSAVDSKASTEVLTQAGELNSAFKNFKSNLESGLLSAANADNVSMTLTDAQVKAGFFGQFGCLTDQNSNVYYEGGNLSLTGGQGDGNALSLADSLGTDFALQDFGAGNLAFSVEDNMNASQFSTLINIALAKQEDLIERFFPTIVVDPKETGVKATVKLTSFTNEWTRDINDDRSVKSKMDNKSIIKNIYNNEILGEDRTRVIPVYRTQFDNFLVKDIQFTETMTGETIVSAPYKFGEKFDIIRLSQSDRQLEQGKMDNTDSLLPTITLSNLYLGFTIGGEKMKFKLDVSTQPGSNFGFIGTGHFKGLQLSFEERPLTINFGSTTQVNGVSIPVGVKTEIENALTAQGIQNGSWANYRFTFLVSVAGNTNIETAETVLYGNKIKLAYITDENNQQLDLTKGLGKALYDCVSNMEFIGYDLIAYRSNTNLRTKGRLVKIDEYTTYLVAPWRGPFQVMGPITRHTGNECDYDHVGSLITCITAASDVHGMLTLERYADSLRLRVKNPTAVSHEFEYGFNDQLVDTYFLDRSINLTDHVDSLMSHQRMLDTQAALLNELRLSCLQMLIDSNYLLAYNVLYRQSGQKPIILIGTDPIIKEFLLYGNEGSNVIPGVNFDIVVDSILNPAIRGKMYITMTLGKNIGDLNGIQALNFGYRLYSIAVTATINPDTNGNKALMRTIVIPRYHHIPLLPIMMVYEVSGLPEVIKKLPVITK